MESTRLFVSIAEGKDTWSGRLAAPASDGSDGPLQTVQRAVEVARTSGVREIRLRGGCYPLASPLCLNYRDNGLVLAAHEAEEVAFDGGNIVTGWVEKKQDGRRVWSADVSALLEQTDRPFRSLFVNGQRRSRPRWPKQGFFRVQDPSPVAQPQLFDGTYRVQLDTDIPKAWALAGAELRILHKWVDERMPIRHFEREERVVHSPYRSMHAVSGQTEGWKRERAYLDNVRGAFSEPGEWYLDEQARQLQYLPLPEETLEKTTVIVPGALQLLRIEGELQPSRLARNIKIQGIIFRHTDWVQPVHDWGYRFDPVRPPNTWHKSDAFDHFIRNNELDPGLAYAAAMQGAHNVPGVLYMFAAQDCTISDCRIEHGGFYGIELRDGCCRNNVVGNRIVDMGGGGVNIDGGNDPSKPERHATHNIIQDNTIQAAGKVFNAACGVLICFGARNQIVGNEISDLRYTGISVGWAWFREHQTSRENLVAYNHIHHLRGEDVLSDLGGIYILGIQPGTVLRGNHIHDVDRDAYGGIGIYTDASTANVIVEDNLIYDVMDSALTVNLRNCENVYRRNILALAGSVAVSINRNPVSWMNAIGDVGKAATVLRNVMVTQDSPAFGFCVHPNECRPEQLGALCVSDANLLWDLDTKGVPAVFASGWDRKPVLDWEQWRELGQDTVTAVTDPGFRDLAKRDFFPLPKSAADALLKGSVWHPAKDAGTPYPAIQRYEPPAEEEFVPPAEDAKAD